MISVFVWPPYPTFLSFLFYLCLSLSNLLCLSRIQVNKLMNSSSGLWGADAEEMVRNNKSRRKKPICDDPASMYRHDRAFLSALRSADLTAYSYGSPRIGTPNFCKVSASARQPMIHSCSQSVSQLVSKRACNQLSEFTHRWVMNSPLSLHLFLIFKISF